MQLPPHITKAIHATMEASQAIMDIYAAEIKPSFKSDGSPVTAADMASSKVLMKYLGETGIPIISEEVEKAGYKTRKNWKAVWIVDPLDGTKEFIRRNGEFVICIALIEEGNPIFGIITHPLTQQILFGGPDFGAYKVPFSEINEPQNWKAIESTSLNNPIILSSSRTPYKSNEIKVIEALEKQFDTITYSKKGSALKFYDLALGKSDIYPRFAPTMEWDIAAGQAIITALGGMVVDPETLEPLQYNKESLYNSHFIVYTKALKEALNL